MLGAALLALAVTPWVGVGAAAATPGDVPPSGDTRATSYAGNATTCAEAGLAGSKVRVTSSSDGTLLDITAVPEGTTVTGVVVKGGNGYNVYAVGSLGDLPWLDLHAPHNASGGPAGISHWYACGQTTVVDDEPQPTGTLTGDCSDSAHFIVSGTFDTDGADNVQFRLAVEGETPIALTESPFRQRITSPVGTDVTLEYRIGDGPWTSTGETVTVFECEPQGSFTATCTATGAEVDLDRLRRGTFNGGHFELVVNGTAQTVVSQQQDIAVPGGATLVLQYVTSDDEVIVLQEGTAPAACPDVTPVAPTGAFTTECTATGAVADVGTLATGTATGGTFHLVATGFDQAVTSGQQDVTVPASAAVRLEYRVSGDATVLDSEQTPAACPAVAPVRGLGVVKAVSPTGAATFGATLTYSLTVSTTGNAAQTDVTVTDDIPTGTTYVVNSAACDAGTCSVTVANGVVTWGLGTMAAGTSRTVTFAVTINTPAAAPDGSIPAVEIVNTGAARSAEVGVTPSNEVRTPVAAVQGVKVGADGGEETPAGNDKPDTVVAGVKSGPAVLAATGAGLSLPGALGISALLLMAGTFLLRIGAARR